MKFKFFGHTIDIDTENIPLWLKLLNGVNLLPILAWPIVFVFSIFLFDNPKIIEALGMFFLILSYPLLLLGSLKLSFKLYKKSNVVLSILIPLGMTTLLISMYYYTTSSLNIL